VRFRSREDRIDNGLSRQDRIDVLRFWGLVREQDRCFSDFDVCAGTGQMPNWIFALGEEVKT